MNIFGVVMEDVDTVKPWLQLTVGIRGHLTMTGLLR